jgi:hypothetical protein
MSVALTAIVTFSYTHVLVIFFELNHPLLNRVTSLYQQEEETVIVVEEVEEVM